jgi:large repetitive protein
LTSADALGRVTTNVYDTLGRLSTTTLPNGLQTKNTYNARNEIMTKKIISSTKTLTTSYTYDDDGRVLSETDTL